VFFPLQVDEFLLFIKVKSSLDNTEIKKTFIEKAQTKKGKFKISKRLANSTCRIRKVDLYIRQIPGLQN